MSEEAWRSDLALIPFPRVLHEIWKRKDTGQLRIRGEGIERSACFVKGDLALADGHFSNALFLKILQSRQLLGSLQAEECERYAREKGLSYPRSVIERELVSAPLVWESLAESWRMEFLAVFDWPRAELDFQTTASPRDCQVYRTFPTPEIILWGIREMKNHSLIEAFLPAETESLQVLPPGPLDELQLAPHETHVLRALRHTPRLADLYAISQAGKRETQKAVFAFLSLGLAGPSPPPGAAKAVPEISSAGLEKTWSSFNDKCTFIHKYISKEIGPVGLSVLEKALEEVRARLTPPFQGLDLRSDGRVEFSPFPLMSLILSDQQTRQDFIRLLNEILVAEVLAVKKTLGNAHEAAVVRSLEKIGEPS